MRAMAWRGLVVALGLWGGAVHAREGLDVALSRHETELVEAHERRPTLATRQALIEAGQSRSDACDAAYEAGDREASLPSCLAAATLIESALGPDHPDLVEHLVDVAYLLRQQGRYADAVPLYRRALTITERTRGPDHPDVGVRASTLGLVLKQVGRYDEAEALYRRALTVSEAALGPHDPTVGIRVNNLALLLEATGRYDEAETLLRRAVAIAETAQGPGHPATGTRLNNLAFLLDTLGRYAEAEPLYRRALAIAEAAHGPDAPGVATPLNNLAAALLSLGRYAEAEPLFRRALAITESDVGPHHPDVGTAVSNLAFVLDETGRLEESEPLFRRALAIAEAVYGPEHPEVGRSLNNLAAVLQATDRLEEAEPLCRRAVAIAEATFGSEHLNVSVNLGNLAVLLERLGRYDEAEPLQRRTLAITEATVGSEHPWVATDLNNLATLLQATGRYDEAEAALRRAASIVEGSLGPQHPSLADRLGNLAVLQLARGRAGEALALKIRALGIEETVLRRTLFTGTREQRRLRLGQFANSTSGAIDLHLRRLPDDRAAARLALETVLRRKGRLADLDQAVLGLVRASEDAEGLALLDDYQGVVSALGVLAEQIPTDPEALGPWRAERMALAERAATLERSLAARSADLRQLAQPVTVDQVAAMLAADRALLEIAVYQPYDAIADEFGPERYAAYVLRGGGRIAATDLGPADRIDERIRALRGALLVPRPRARGLSRTEAGSGALGPAARALFDAVLRPLWAELDGVGHILVAADGRLNLVPFDVLLAAGEQDADQVQISYLTSGRDLLRIDGGADRLGRPVVVSDVDHDRAVRPGGSAPETGPVASWEALPGAAREGRRVRRALRRARSLEGAYATESALRQIARPRVLHIASHGYFRSDGGDDLATSPLLRSGVVLAGANLPPAGDDNGLLTAAELANLDLRNTRLVVLSACETGTGEVRNGDGVLGLRRGLVLAGARAQVLSLWRVDDEATAFLMKAFYRQLRRGHTVGEALRSAQGAVRAEPRWAHPFYWAAFTVSGDAETRL